MITQPIADEIVTIFTHSLQLLWQSLLIDNNHFPNCSLKSGAYMAVLAAAVSLALNF